MLKLAVFLVFALVTESWEKSIAGKPVMELLDYGEINTLEGEKRSTSQQFVYDVIADHNRMRAIHQVDPLTEDPALTDIAQAWAEHLAETGEFKHNPDRGNSGENIAYSTWSGADGTYFSQLWYSEVKHYDGIYGRNLNDFNEFFKVGHFTQLVWKGTNKIGVGKATKDGKTYVVANYYPPGNYWNQFATNVLPPQF